MNILRIREQRGKEDPMLVKYALVGRMLSGNPSAGNDQACGLLLETLQEWTEKLGIPRLGDYGLEGSDLGALAAQAGQKANPVQLDAQDVKAILRARL
jgi:alcohol dehydrogenase class IV